MEIDKEQKKRITKWILGIATAIILIFLGVQNISHVANAFDYAVGLLMPLLLGVVIAVILNVPMRFFEMQLFKITKNKHLQKLGRPLAFLLSLVLIVGIIAGIIRLVIPELASALSIIVDGAIDAINKLSSMSQEELMELGINEDMVNEICYGIAIHVDDEADFDGERTALALCIGDADNIDRFDAFRLYESILDANYRELSLNEQYEFCTKRIERLKLLVDFPMSSKTARDLWQEKIRYQISFIERLKKQVDNSYLQID